MLSFPVWNYGYPAILKGFFDRVFLPGVSFRLVDGKAQPSLHNIRKVAAVTTYGGSRFRAVLMGDPPRKLVNRLLRATVKPGAPVSYLAHYSMNLSTTGSREDIHGEGGGEDGRVLMRVPGRLLPSGAGEFLRGGARRGGRSAITARGYEVRLVDLYAEGFRSGHCGADERRAYNGSRARPIRRSRRISRT